MPPSDESHYRELSYFAEPKMGSVHIAFSDGDQVLSFVCPPPRARKIAETILRACDKADKQMPPLS